MPEVMKIPAIPGRPSWPIHQSTTVTATGGSPGIDELPVADSAVCSWRLKRKSYSAEILPEPAEPRSDLSETATKISF